MKALVELSLNLPQKSSAGARGCAVLCGLLLLVSLISAQAARNAGATGGTEIERFQAAWEAARQGDHQTLRQIKGGLQSYLLYPYLQYEDYRNRRRSVDSVEMAAFLGAHRDWAFEAGLRRAWLKALAERGHWADLLAHSNGVEDTELACHKARARIILGRMDGLVEDIRKLWAVGHSQPQACDVPFTWMIKTHGVSEGLAWQRVFLAIEANDRALVRYLARFVPATGRRWLDDWRSLSRGGYARMERMKRWQDNPTTRSIAALSLQRLARSDAALAAQVFDELAAHFAWQEERKRALWREIALYSAVSLDADTAARMARVDAAYRDSQLLEWWARFALAIGDWTMLSEVISWMEDETRNDQRWRYWLAQARLRSGQAVESTGLRELADEASYYGFLAADELELAYNVCPEVPGFDAAAVGRLAEREGLKRALELRKAGLDNWAIAEWSRAVNRLPAEDLVAAAALAQRENWPDRVIFALGDSGHRQFYAWRFPLAFEVEVQRFAAANALDPAWVFGTARAESAMVVGARSSANALGLMQVTPATARRVAREQGLAWRGSEQLRTVEGNLAMGTAIMAELVQEYAANPVLVSGAYNAGPNAVDRWLDNRPRGEAAVWVDTLPYFETRDYIPRVLAFTTLYDWRLGEPVNRISSRMPHLESGKIRAGGTTGVECRDAGSRMDTGK
ncbi:MAG: transglycosylase SLT domain-containing protein [Lysobacterales bacterium]|jgi:soluble lytic murein transglycosylase